MKTPNHGWTFVFLGVLSVAVVWGWIYVSIKCDGTKDANWAKAVEVDNHVHKWGKWGEPITTSNWYVGTFFSQSRTCETCGAAEMREIQVSAHSNK